MDLRRHHRVPFAEPVVFSRKNQEDRVQGQSTDISLGGMFIETVQPAPFNSEILVHVHIPGQASAFSLPAIVRWVGSGGMGVQFGLLGARETHTITELVRRSQK